MGNYKPTKEYIERLRNGFIDMRERYKNHPEYIKIIEQRFIARTPFDDDSIKQVLEGISVSELDDNLSCRDV